jgi:hypothetical protein
MSVYMYGTILNVSVKSRSCVPNQIMPDLEEKVL